MTLASEDTNSRLVDVDVENRLNKILKLSSGRVDGQYAVKIELALNLKSLWISKKFFWANLIVGPKKLNGLLQQCLLLVRLQHLLDGQPAVEV